MVVVVADLLYSPSMCVRACNAIGLCERLLTSTFLGASGPAHVEATAR